MPGEEKITKIRVIFTVFFLTLITSTILILSGDYRWIEGWFFSFWFIILCLAAIVYLYRKDPALLAERYRQNADNQAGWDKYFMHALKLLFLIWLFIMPLDSKKFHWSPAFPVWLKILGGFALLFSAFFMYRSYTDNTYLSPLVRIQSERKQKLVSTGVYGCIRHPLYLGGILMFLGGPVLLGSIMGLLAGIILTLLFVGRIAREEKLLQKELGGYETYKKKVKFRLIPFIW